MNRKLHCPLVAAALAVAAIAATGCGDGKTSKTDGSAAKDLSAIVNSIRTVTRTAQADTLCYDTVSCQMNYPGVESSIAMDFPRGDSKIAAAVRQFINERLADMYLPNPSAYEGSTERVAYQGDLSDAQAMMQFYVKGNAEWMKQDREASEMEEEMSYLRQEKVRKAYEAAKYLVYDVTAYTEMGGAHGAFGASSYVISKLTGKMLTQTVDTTRVKQLQPLIRKGVINYFHEIGETDVNESNLLDNLMLGDGATEVPLPATAPVFTREGVSFTYQQYEIAAYCYGLVCFTVPYDDIKPYLVPEAKALVE